MVLEYVDKLTEKYFGKSSMANFDTIEKREANREKYKEFYEENKQHKFDSLEEELNHILENGSDIKKTTPDFRRAINKTLIRYENFKNKCLSY